MNTDFTFKLPVDMMEEFRSKCGLIAMSKILRLLIAAFVSGKITLDDLSD